MSQPFPPSYPPPPPPRRGWSTATIAAVTAVSLVVGVLALGLAAWAAVSVLRGHDGGGSGPAAQPPSPSGPTAMPATPSALSTFYGQKLRWTSCDNGDRCARLKVPLDYAKPDGTVISLAVVSVPAQRRSERVGQLVVNPGGPGGSGVEYAEAGEAAFGPQLSRYFDIVGFDPRGVGGSTPLRCATTAETDRFLASDPDPDNQAEVDTLTRLTRDYGEGCLKRSGDLTRHMSTVEVAKDMDILRAALGEPKLDYLGASYGTLIGTTYADLFPTHVRRMVLDGAIDPSLSNVAFSLGQAKGFQTAFEAYLRDCVSRPGCPLGSTVASAQTRLGELVKQLDATPLPTSSGRPLTEGLATYGMFQPLYLKQLWPLLTAALRQALDQRRGDLLLQLSDQYTSRGPSGYTDNAIAALYAVNCLDHSDATPMSQVPAQFAAFEKVSPVFGRGFAYSLSTCAAWPVDSGQTTHAMKAAGAPPIVVVGTTRDPATPYPWAVALSKQLQSGVLVSRDGDGHTGFQQGNTCVDDAVEGYLVRGKVPRNGLSC
ncbi:alpha/beta hydrolase [Nocardioides korecus]